MENIRNRVEASSDKTVMEKHHYTIWNCLIWFPDESIDSKINN